MQKQPLLFLCICFIFGIFFEDFFLLPLISVIVILIISLLIAVASRFSNFYLQKFKFHFLGLLFFSIGITSHFLNFQKPVLPSFQQKEIAVFKLNKKLNSNEKNKRYEITILNVGNNLKSDNLPVNAVLSVPKSEAELDFKHYYKAKIYLNKVISAKGNFAFNYEKYLARKKIYFQAYLSESRETAERSDLNFSEIIRQKRLQTLHKIDSANLSSTTREFTKGIILADRTEMDNQTVQDFSKSGLVHILAISGSHMMIIFWLILLVLKPIFPAKLKNLKIIIALILIWGFAVFIDYGSSVMRSCIMISVYYTFVLLQRKPDLLHAMALSAFLILINDTHQLFDVGFQLSFLAVFGIFWFNQPILKLLPKANNKLKRIFFNIFSVSLSAQIATLPLVLFYFHQYSFISIFANLVVIPFSEIIIIFSLLITILISFSIQIAWLNIAYDYCVTSVLKVIHFFGNVDSAFVKNIPMTVLEVLTLFLAIYYLRFLILKFNSKNLLHFSSIMLIFFGLRIGLTIFEFQRNEILVHEYFKERLLSVKQKDHVVFWINENSNLQKIEKSVIDPYITARRIQHSEIKILPKTAKSVQINGRVYEIAGTK